MLQIHEISIEKVFVAEHAVRMEISTEDINGLTSSISRIGIVSPLVVEKTDDGFKVICGHRRFKAAGLANLKKVPCIIRDSKLADVKEITFAENFFRADLSPIEQAAAIKDVIDSGAMTVEQVAAGFHRSEHWVAQQVAILDWPDDVLAAVHTGSMSVAAASNLALVTDDNYRSFLVRNGTESGITARVSAAWLQAWRSMAPPEEAIVSEPEPAGPAVVPAVPQAPCIFCAEIIRTDSLSSVLMCGKCILTLRNAAC